MIIVFGSMNIDMVMMVDHFPAPGETVLCPTDYLTRTGGKGSNQAVAAIRAGAKVAMVGQVGDDSFGRRSVNNLKKQGVLTSGIGMSERPTGCAMIAVDRTGENMVMAAAGANLDATSDQIPDEILTSRNTVLTQLEMAADQTLDILRRARKGGARTILNASPASKVDPEMLQLAGYTIMNEVESRQLCKLLDLDEQDPVERARALAAHSGGVVIITLEAKGAVAAKGKEVWAVDTLDIDPVDTTGAGDVFCGVFAACLEAGFDLQSSLHRASVGAALSCLGVGAQGGIPFMDDIVEKMPRLASPRVA